jgi:hypothetical protein
MTIVINETTMLQMDKMQSCMIITATEKEKVLKTSDFLGLFPQYKTIEKPYYELQIKYRTTEDRGARLWKCSHSDHATLAKLAKSVIAQVQKYDDKYIDTAFEDVVLKGK